MPVSDFYTVDSGLVAQASTTQTPILELRTAATKRAFITGIRIAVGVTAAAAGNSVLFTLARAGNTPAGGTAANLRPHDPASATAISSAFTGSWGTAPTLGNILGEWELQQVSGDRSPEFPPEGMEWVVPVSGSVVGFVTTGVATSTPVSWQFIVSE